MGGHRRRKVGVGAEGREIPLQFRPRGFDAGKLQMAVGQGAAVAGNMFHHRHDTAGHEAPRGGAAETRDIVRIVGIGAVADHLMRARRRGIQHRQAIDVDPHGA